MTELYNRLYVYDEILGFEKKEISEEIKNILKNNPQSYKILVLGDSVTYWGKYVDYFNNLLAQRYHGEIKVINAGVMGYDTELEYRYLKYRGLDLKPNLVILQFSMNDFTGTPVILKQKDGSWLALSGNKKIAEWISPKLMSSSKLYEFVALRLLRASRLKRINNNVVKEPLQKIKLLLQEKGIAFYILVFPRLTESQWIAPRYNAHREIMGILNELNLSSQVVDLLPYYSRLPFHEIRIDLNHPNDQGDKIAAAALGDKLRPFLDEQLKSK
jgi:lysophospholipase L1-like esterase